MSINGFSSQTHHSSRNPEFRFWKCWIGRHVGRARRRRLTTTSSPLSGSALGLLHRALPGYLFATVYFERLQEPNALLASLLCESETNNLSKHEISQFSGPVSQFSLTPSVRLQHCSRRCFYRRWTGRPVSYGMVIKVKWYNFSQFANPPIGGNGLNRCPPIHIFRDLNSGFLVEWWVGE